VKKVNGNYLLRDRKVGVWLFGKILTDTIKIKKEIEVGSMYAVSLSFGLDISSFIS
jgi:hypothetical protein